MKRKIRKCLSICLIFVFVMMINVPAFAKSSKKSKVAMPKKVTEYSVDDDGELQSYPTEFTISYDKSGRIKKISALSNATDSTWTYTISYKKSGKNTKATIKYEPSWAEDSETYTYTFNSKGRLASTKKSDKSSKWEWGYTNESEETLYLYAEDNYLAYFDNNAKFDLCYLLEGDKPMAMVGYDYKKEMINKKANIYFGGAVEWDSVTEDFLEGLDGWISKYEIKTSKVSMTDAVKWMNAVLLLDFVYYG